MERCCDSAEDRGDETRGEHSGAEVEADRKQGMALGRKESLGGEGRLLCLCRPDATLELERIAEVEIVVAKPEYRHRHARQRKCDRVAQPAAIRAIRQPRHHRRCHGDEKPAVVAGADTQRSQHTGDEQGPSSAALVPAVECHRGSGEEGEQHRLGHRRGLQVEQ